MMITTRKLSADDLRDIVNYVSDRDYDSNLTIDIEQKSKNVYRLKMGAYHSRKHGARTSWNGRHGKWACWHAFRDVIADILTHDPKATIRTMHATYNGASGFLREFPGTAYLNIGSMMRPTYPQELCVDCDPLAPSDYVQHLEGE